MSDDRKSTGAGTWSLLIIGALLLYPVSLGPACWISSRVGGEKVVTIAYRPLTWAAEVIGSNALMTGIQAYSRLGTIEFWVWTLNPDEPGGAGWLPVPLGGDVFGVPGFSHPESLPQWPTTRW